MDWWGRAGGGRVGNFLGALADLEAKSVKPSRKPQVPHTGAKTNAGTEEGKASAKALETTVDKASVGKATANYVTVSKAAVDKTTVDYLGDAALELGQKPPGPKGGETDRRWGTIQVPGSSSKKGGSQ